jgi:endonuclease III
MPRESQATRSDRTARILRALRETYPDAHCELNFRNPLELLIATILSAQCTDKQVNIVSESLFKKYRTAADYAGAELGELENDIRRIGLFRNKAKNIKACCQQLVDRFTGEVPQTLEELISLDGVGRKTANVVLGNAFNRNEGVVVDTHVARLAQRFGLTKEEKPDRIEIEMMRLVPREDWTMFSHWLIWHGRRRCFARGPQCGECEIRELCPSRQEEL